MVSELLLLSAAGERDAPASDVDLREAAEAAAARFGEARVTGTSAVVRAARADVDRALDSLVENAVNYSPEGSEVVIEVSAREIAVLDSGPGVAPGEEEAVFERFHRGRAGRAGAAGTGLGLPIARELMRRWGAEVSIATRPEGGARAAIRFGEVESS
jgi:signal transduction histidine kinase